MFENVCWTIWIDGAGRGVAEFSESSVRILDVENQDDRREFRQCKSGRCEPTEPRNARERRVRETRDRTIRRRLGRPPKPRDEVRSERVVSFVTQGEFDALLELADNRGESVSAVVHRILRSALTKVNS